MQQDQLGMEMAGQVPCIVYGGHGTVREIHGYEDLGHRKHKKLLSLLSQQRAHQIDRVVFGEVTMSGKLGIGAYCACTGPDHAVAQLATSSTPALDLRHSS